LNDARKHAPVGEMLWAISAALAGDREQTIALLQKGAANHAAEFSYGVRDPLFDFVRSDPRYIETMKRVGLPP
jgi:hypothetical protein